MKLLRPLWVALQLLTRLPTPDPGAPEPPTLARSVLCYPLVGALIGAGVAVTGWALAPHLAALPLAAVLLTEWVLLTGALHLDGLADSADGWLGGFGNRERTLEIMRDPRSGSAAVVIVGLVLLLKFAALSELVGSGHWLELLTIPLLARTLLPLLFLTTPAARTDGMVAGLLAALPRRTAWAGVLAVGLGTLLLWPQALKLIGAGLVCGWLLRRMMLQRIGGLTGDTAGALVEISEAAMLLVLATT